MRSLTYDIGRSLSYDDVGDQNLCVVFSSIVNIIETAMMSSSTVSLIEPSL